MRAASQTAETMDARAQGVGADRGKISQVKQRRRGMQHECKITVLETKVFPELQEKYLADAGGISS